MILLNIEMGGYLETTVTVSNVIPRGVMAKVLDYGFEGGEFELQSRSLLN